MSRFARSLVAAALLAAACGNGDRALAGCGEGRPVTDRPLRIATTVSPLTSIVAALSAGAGNEVNGLVPEGVDSHTHEPRPRDVAVLADADIVFVNGLGLESQVVELARANAATGAELCRLGDAVLPEEEFLFDASFPQAAGEPNPHLWTNPPMVADYASLVRDVLIARDPGDADVYVARHTEFVERLERLDAAIRAAAETIPPEQRVLLTYHDAYAYTAREYGWSLLGAVQPASFDEPSPSDVAELVEQVRRSGVRTVFGSEVFPSPVLEQVAAETGATYVADLRDDDLPGDPGDAEHSWFGLMRVNFSTIIDGLGGDAAALRTLDLGPSLPDEARYP